MKRFGLHGKYLLIDVTDGTAQELPIVESVQRAYLGGVGLGAWLLLRHGKSNYDPLGPEAPLILSFSPLIGSPLTTSAKFAVLSKSPLTHRINDSLCSSAFALAGKRTGFDAIVIVGAAKSPSVLQIDDSNVHCRDATKWWGKSISDTQILARRDFGKECESLLIGPAGENQVRFATISHDGRHAGRGGAGAVMGSKKIKAIVVNGTRRAGFADTKGLGDYAKQLSTASLGPATEKYRELGTVANTLLLNRLNALPTRNFQQAKFEHAESLSGESLAESNQVVRTSCASCGIGCEHLFMSPSAQLNGDKAVRLEYENVFALGPLCGIGDPNTVLRASQRCDELGLDTISMGGTLAFAMECAERGWLDEPSLRFGCDDTLLDLIDATAYRRGIGDRLAEGSRHFSKELGEKAESIAAHVKGLELPGYDPRTMQTLAVGLSVAARGADHNRSGAYQADLSPGVDRREIDQDTAMRVVQAENESALYDSLILCKFLRRALGNQPLDEMVQMIRLTTGWQLSATDLTEIAQRITDARHCFNIEQGWSNDEDSLPERFFLEGVDEPDGSKTSLNRVDFQQAIQEYYRLRGWSETGAMSAAAIDRLDGDSLINELMATASEIAQP